MRGDINGYEMFPKGSKYKSGSGNYRDCTGMTFGRLYVLERAGSNRRGAALWKCECECGKIVPAVLGAILRAGKVRSCGCWRRDNRRAWGLSGGLRGKKSN